MAAKACLVFGQQGSWLEAIDIANVLSMLASASASASTVTLTHFALDHIPINGIPKEAAF